MGRPAASEQNKKLSVLFAKAVTISVQSKSTTIQRSGEGGLFFVFAQCFPECIRTNSRVGLTQLEFNKHLQYKDFPQIRKRNRARAGARERRQLDFFPTSSFRFAGKQWRNPDNTHDLEFLRKVWPILINGISNPISFEGFLAELRNAIAFDCDGTFEDCDESDAASACNTPKKEENYFGVESPRVGEKAVFNSEEEEVKSDLKFDGGFLDLPWSSSHSEESVSTNPANASSEENAQMNMGDFCDLCVAEDACSHGGAFTAQEEFSRTLSVGKSNEPNLSAKLEEDNATSFSDGAWRCEGWQHQHESFSFDRTFSATSWIFGRSSSAPFGLNRVASSAVAFDRTSSAERWFDAGQDHHDEMTIDVGN